MTSQNPKSAYRLAFIDVMRGLAALWMIETHSVNEFLAPVYKAGSLFSLLNISNGFVSVVFIFCAGAGFWLALERKHEDYQKIGPALRTYCKRLLFILGIAYLLQTPKFSLSATLNSTDADILRLLQCNILHLIVFSSFAALSVAIFIKNLRTIRLIFAVFCLAGMVLTPALRSFDAFSVFPVFPATLFTGLPVSLFPLFPWSCYFFAGAVATSLFRESENASRFAKFSVLASITTIVLVFLIKDGFHWYSYQQGWWAISPEHTLFRIAGAILLFSGLFLIESYLGGRVGSLLQTAGQESLYIYVLQGVIIYSTIGKYKLADVIGANLTPLEVSGVIALIVIFCLTTAIYWHRFKKSRPNAARKTIRIAFATTLLLFAVFPATF